jgi:uncharacterized protein
MKYHEFSERLRKEARMPKTAILLERRVVQTKVELRTQGNKVWIEGYAAVFGKRSGNLGGFVEVVESSAFNKTIRESDVRALHNHDPNRLLGRMRANTLALSVDSRGLYYRIDPPNTTYANDLVESMGRGDVDQSSFQFWKVQDTWDLTEEDFPQRHLLEVGLVEVSPVTFPAYEDATSGLARNAALDGLSKRSGMSIVDLSDEDAIKKAIQEKFEPGHSDGEPSTKDTQDDTSTRSRDLKAEAAKAAAEYEEFTKLFS